MTRADACPERRALPERGPVLVLAPHPDDELLGCGGTLAIHARQGDPITVVYAFDGALGDATGAWEPEELVRARRAEARAGMDELLARTTYELEFWDLPEGHLPSEHDLTAATLRVRERLDALDPATVYAPWRGEGHPDHRSLARALERALLLRPGSPLAGRAWGYEVWTPLRPDRVVDVTDVIDAKRRALARHSTQMVSGDLAHRALGLAAYRSQHLSRGARYGEAFSVLGNAAQNAGPGWPRFGVSA